MRHPTRASVNINFDGTVRFNIFIRLKTEPLIFEDWEKNHVGFKKPITVKIPTAFSGG